MIRASFIDEFLFMIWACGACLPAWSEVGRIGFKRPMFIE
jgi:hypothetical protein